jgi:hypothetical protein
VRDATGGMSMPTVVESDPARDVANTANAPMGGSIQETAGALYSKLPQGVRSFGEQPAGNLLPTGAWDYFFNSIPGFDQRGQSGNTTSISPSSVLPGHAPTTESLGVGLDQFGGRNPTQPNKPAWMQWLTPKRFESGNYEPTPSIGSMFDALRR